MTRFEITFKRGDCGISLDIFVVSCVISFLFRLCCYFIHIHLIDHYSDVSSISV